MEAEDHARARRPTGLRQRARALRARLLRYRPLACQEVVELVTAYLEGTLDPALHARFEVHLRDCDGCSAYLEELRVTVSTLGTIRDEHLDPVYRARLLDAFAEATRS